MKAVVFVIKRGKLRDAIPENRRQEWDRIQVVHVSRETPALSDKLKNAILNISVDELFKDQQK